MSPPDILYPPCARHRFILAALWLLVPYAAASTLHLRFQHEVDGRPLVADSIRYETSAREAFSVTRLDWLATGFSLVTTSGGHALPDTTAFVPMRGESLALRDLPAGKLTAICFHLGPDKVTNHADPARFSADHPLNPNLNRLHWDWKGGYIFLAIEGHWRAGDELLPGGYAYHFANDPNRVEVTLPVEIDLRDETVVTIALDVQKLLAGLSFVADGARRTVILSPRGSRPASRPPFASQALTKAMCRGRWTRHGPSTCPRIRSPIPSPSRATSRCQRCRWTIRSSRRA
jgi:hypothetical protein